MSHNHRRKDNMYKYVEIYRILSMMIVVIRRRITTLPKDNNSGQLVSELLHPASPFIHNSTNDMTWQHQLPTKPTLQFTEIPF